MENNDLELEQKPKIITRSAIIYASFVILLPALVGLPVFFAMYKDVVVFEIMYVVAGLLSILFIFIRGWARDNQNLKKTGSIKEDKLTKEYKERRNFTYVMLIVGLIDLLLSLVFYIIRINIPEEIIVEAVTSESVSSIFFKNWWNLHWRHN